MVWVTEPETANSPISVNCCQESLIAHLTETLMEQSDAFCSGRRQYSHYAHRVPHYRDYKPLCQKLSLCVCVCVCCADDKWPLHLLRARSKATLIFSFPSFQGNIVRKGKVSSQQIHTNTHTCTVFFSDHTHQICKSEDRHRHKQLWPHVLTWDLVSVITWWWILFHFYFVSHLVCELDLEIYKH